MSAHGAARSGRREELIDAAAGIFLDKGYHATSVQDIAEVLGILKGSVYYYIDSKEDLLFEIVQSQVAANDARIRQANRAASPLEAIRVFFHLAVLDHARNPVRQPVAVREQRMLTGDRADLAARGTDRLVRFFRKQLTAGRRDGAVCTDLDPGIGAKNLYTMFVGLHWTTFTGNRRNADRVAEAYGDMAVASIACETKRHKAGHRHTRGATPATNTLVAEFG